MTVQFRFLRFSLLFFITALCFNSAVHAQSGELAGAWQGTIEIPDNPLNVEVMLQLEEGSWQGTIDIPAQGAHDLPLEDVRVEDDEVRFSITGAQGEPTFKGTVVDDSIEGTFSQAGQEFPFRLMRIEDGDIETAQAAMPTTPTAEPEPEAAEVYEEPEGRFTVPVPANWTVEEQNGLGVLTSPDEGITIYALVVAGDNIENAIAEAWERVEPGFDLEPEQVQEPPATGGVEQVLVITYDTPTDDEIVQAVGQLHEEIVYVLLVEAELTAAQQRSSQINIINTGFTITALEEEDLTDREPQELTAELLSTLEAYIEEALERFGVPGAAVAVVQDGQIVYTKGFGTRGPQDDAPITPKTHMMIGSTTKTMTTLLMATLVDEGHMTWDTPVVDVLPEFAVADPELTQQITLEQLVCACTGVPRRDFELFFNLEELDAEGVVESLSDFEFFTDFGEAFQYSNQMVATGGYAAAAAGGAEYGDLYGGYVRFMQENVLNPMGLTYTTFSFDEIQQRGNYATPHSFTRDLNYEPIPLTIEEIVTPVAPAGGLWSNTIDMGRYLITAMNEGVAPDGLRVVSEDNLRHTWEPQVPATADTSYGLGWFVDEYKGLRFLHHGGNTVGFTSDLAFLPEVGVGISVITNGRMTNPFNEAVRFRLFELVFDLEPEHDAQAMFMYENLRDMLQDMLGELDEQVDPEAVAPHEGRYTNPALGEIELALVGDQLRLDAGAFAVTLLPRKEDGEYVAVDEPVFGQQVRLAEDEEGFPVIIVGEGAFEYAFERVE